MAQNNGKRSVTKPPPRDVVYQLAHEQAIRLMRYDRKRSYLGKRSIMEWSNLQTTAGLRCIESWCYGPYGNLGNPTDPTDQPHRKAAHANRKELWFGNLAMPKQVALRMVFTIVCVCEMQKGRSLDTGYDIVLPGMQHEWYADLIDLADIIASEAKYDLTASINLWLHNVRRAKINRELREAKRRNATKVKQKASESADAETAARLDRNPKTKQMVIEAEAEVYEAQLAEVIHLFPFTG